MRLGEVHLDHDLHKLEIILQVSKNNPLTILSINING